MDRIKLLPRSATNRFPDLQSTITWNGILNFATDATPFVDPAVPLPAKVVTSVGNMATPLLRIQGTPTRAHPEKHDVHPGKEHEVFAMEPIADDNPVAEQAVGAPADVEGQNEPEPHTIG